MTESVCNEWSATNGNRDNDGKIEAMTETKAMTEKYAALESVREV